MSFLFFFLAVMLALLVLRMLPLLLTVVGVIWLWGDHRLILIACIVAGIGADWPGLSNAIHGAREVAR